MIGRGAFQGKLRVRRAAKKSLRGTELRQLVAGNWKMNGLGADLAQLEALKQGLESPVPIAMSWSVRRPA